MQREEEENKNKKKKKMEKRDKIKPFYSSFYYM